MDLNQKRMALHRQQYGEHTETHKQALNTQINIPQKIASFNNSTTDYSDRFNELPAFCEHLPTEFKNAMISLKELHNTPYEFSLSVLLGMANTATHHLYDVNSYKYGIRPTSLFIMIILGTGGSKSTIEGEVKGPFKSFSERMYEALKNEDARYISEMKIYKKKIAQYEKDLEQGITQPFPQKPIPAETANYINSKFTVNGIIDTLKSQPHASIITAEAGEFFSSHAFQGGKQDANRATEMTSSLTKLWDGDNLSRNIKDERITIMNRRVNSLLMVQEGVIRPILNNKTFQEQGFTHRILISQIEAFDKPDMSFDTNIIEREDYARFGLKRYLDKLDNILYKRPTMLPDKHFELQPIVINSTEEAKRYMGDFYNKCKDIGKYGNKLQRYEGFANRIHEHMIRVAATLAAFNDNDVVEITINEAKASVDIMNMFINHRAGLEMGITDTRPELTQGASVLEDWYRKSENVNKSMTKRELSAYGPIGFRTISDEQRTTILAELLCSEILVGVETVAKNNRKTVKYELNKDTV
tara:strand:- start:2883 stop:4469 length:1587 start_codon:yes stop_codon:yes gene_type:complete